MDGGAVILDGIRRRKGGKRGLPRTTLRRESLDSATVFHAFDSFPEPAPNDGGPPHAARPPRRLDRACDRGRPDRGARRAHRDRHPPHRDACSLRAAGEPVRSAKGPPRRSPTARSTRKPSSGASARRSALLAADRDRLLARLNTLERNLEDVTGSIGRRPPRRRSCPASRPIPARRAGRPRQRRLPQRQAAAAAGARPRQARAASRPATSRPATRRPPNRSPPRPSSASTSAATPRSKACARCGRT